MQKTDFSVSQGGIMAVTELLVHADVLFYCKATAG